MSRKLVMVKEGQRSRDALDHPSKKALFHQQLDSKTLFRISDLQSNCFNEFLYFVKTLLAVKNESRQNPRFIHVQIEPQSLRVLLNLVRFIDLTRCELPTHGLKILGRRSISGFILSSC